MYEIYLTINAVGYICGLYLVSNKHLTPNRKMIHTYVQQNNYTYFSVSLKKIEIMICTVASMVLAASHTVVGRVP